MNPYYEPDLFSESNPLPEPIKPFDITANMVEKVITIVVVDMRILESLTELPDNAITLPLIINPQSKSCICIVSPLYNLVDVCGWVETALYEKVTELKKG